MIATTDKLMKTVIKHKGHQAKAAKELGITPQSVSQRINETPGLRETIQERCRRNLEKAGASEERIFKVTAEGLDAICVDKIMKKDKDGNFTEEEVNRPNYKERRESAKLCHQLLGNLTIQGDGPLSSGPIIIMPVITSDGAPLEFKVGKFA